MKQDGIAVGSYMGVKIVLDYSWFLLVAVLMVVFIASSLKYAPHISAVGAVGVGFAMSLLSLCSVIGHELAHSVYANRLGLSVRHVTLFIFGGVSEIEDEPKTPGQEAKIAIVGPLTSVALSALFGLLWYAGMRTESNLLAVTGATLADMNLLFAAFNLLPGFPLDGGRILRALVWRLTGDIERATRLASNAGEALAVLLMAYGVFLTAIAPRARAEGLWAFLVGWLLYSAANQSYRLLIVQLILRNKRVKDFMINRRDKPATATDATVRVKPNDPAFQAAIEVALVARKSVPVIRSNRVIGTFSHGKLDTYMRREMKRRHIDWEAPLAR